MPASRIAQPASGVPRPVSSVLSGDDQLAGITIDPERPLLISDADEVLFAFMDGFERHLHDNAKSFSWASFRLNGNITDNETGEPVEPQAVRSLVYSVPIRLSPTPTICMVWRQVAREADEAGMDVLQRQDLSFGAYILSLTGRVAGCRGPLSCNAVAEAWFFRSWAVVLRSYRLTRARDCRSTRSTPSGPCSELLAMSPLPLTPSFTRAIGSTLNVVVVGDNRIGMVYSFFERHTRTLAAVDKAADSLDRLSRRLQIVVLSNIWPEFRCDRAHALRISGMPYPIIANHGSKAPAVAHLASRTSGPVFFVDDIPMHHRDVSEMAADVIRIHYVSNARLAALLGAAQDCHYSAPDWHGIRDYIEGRLKKN